jgi:hypothetical protein
MGCGRAATVGTPNWTDVLYTREPDVPVIVKE